MTEDSTMGQKPCSFEDCLKEYSKKEPMIARVSSEKKDSKPKYVCTKEGFSLQESSGVNEANIICAGQIIYDHKQAKIADFDDQFLFRGGFKLARDAVGDADLSIASFSGLAADVYPATEVLDCEYNQNPNFRNARSEYLDAIHYGGFDCLSMAGPYCASAGVRGILSTADNMIRHGLIPSGIGTEKNPIIEINNIKIAVLSYSLFCHDAQLYFTEEGQHALLNIYNKEQAVKDITKLRQRGAEFILVYVNCETENGKLPQKQRMDIATDLAQSGADYVVCNVPDELSKYTRITTADNRLVPVATSLGTFISGNTKDAGISALLHITIYRNDEGRIEVSDHFSRIKHYKEHEGYAFTAVPSTETKKVAAQMGKEIQPYKKVSHSLRKDIMPQLTIGEIYDILEAKPSFTDHLRLNMNRKVFIAGRKNDLQRGCAAIRLVFKGFYTESKTQMEEEDAIKAGAVLYIDTKPGKRLPCIVVKNVKTAYIKLMTAVRAKYDPITVAITGTAGKTTTKELMSAVFDTHYKTLHVDGNNNQYVSAGVILQKLTPEYEAYVQEVHGGSKRSASIISRMIRPDIALITNIGEGHLKDMGTIENVIKGKMDIINGLKENGVLIIDDDNKYLHEQHPDCRVIRYSRHNEACDYYARNIEDLGDKLKFQIVCKDGVYDAQLNFQGEHNISNALGVFAAGREAGIPPYKILAGLTHYVPDADKQNLTEVGGYKLLIDSYSSTPVSVESALKGLSDYPLEAGARRIAVVGDIPALGERSEEIHREVAKRLTQYNYDLMICCGDDSVYFVEEARKAGKEAYYFADREEFNRKIIDSIKPGDLILFKGGTRLHFKEETIYPLFGEIV